MKLNWSFDSQKKNTAYFSIFFSVQIKGKRNSLQCFFETLMIEYAWKSLRHSIQQNPRVDFFVDWINSENTLFLKKKKKKKKNERRSWVIWCVFSFANSVLCLLACPAVFFSCQFWILYFECLYKMVLFEALTQSPFLPLAVGKIPGYEIENCQFSSRFSFLSYLQINARIFCIFSIFEIWYAFKKWLNRNDFAQILSISMKVPSSWN